MGNYNPSVPIILGQEWVPIRDEDITFAPSQAIVEVGHEFALGTARQIRDGRFYANELPANPSQYQTVTFAIYPQGKEAQTGPIQQVLIPVNSGAVTGGNITATGGVANALSRPGDFQNITANYDSTNSQDISLFFAVNQYPQLANKRILNVSLVYAGYITRSLVGGDVVPFVRQNSVQQPTYVWIRQDANQQQSYQATFLANTGSLLLDTIVDPASNQPSSSQTLKELNLGDINHFWSPTLGPTGTNDRMPWRYVDLQRFEASATARLHVHITTLSLASTDSIVLEYAALKVTYCEEQRLIYGGRIFNYNRPQMQAITLRDLSHNTDPQLAAGRYTAVLAVVDPGDIDWGQGVNTAFPNLNGIRELYSIPTHPGVQVNVTDTVGETFTTEQTHILPHLSIHASGGTLTEPHVYGRQVAAQVYGVNTATQEIYDDAVGVATSYPQVRWWARRFGPDSGTLTLSGGGSIAASTVSIDSTTFDGLPEIIDGWREVTLRFATPPAMGALVSPEPSFTWRAPGATAGSRWEILGASAPAISGIPGNLFNLVPSPNQLYNATYQPPAGSTVELAWMPQGVASPYVTGTAADQATDAAILFSQDPLTITGVGISTLSQVISGIGLDCGSPPCCIPTGIYYNRVTWPLPNGTAVLSDTYSRTVVSGWGSADTGQAWTNDVGAAGQFSVNGTTGLHSHTAGGAMVSALTGNVVDADATITISIDSVADAADSAIYVRYVDSNNYYRLVYGWTTGALEIGKRVASVNTALVTGVGPTSGVTSIKLRLAVAGTLLMGKAWNATADEPDAWMLMATDTSLTTGRIAASSFNTSTAKVFTFDDLTVGPPDYFFGTYQLQRWDSVTDWQTIMSASSPVVTGFHDYEARVGLESVYRIRATNLYDFAGAWSSQVTGTATAPGVAGCNSDGGVLIFTSNEDQTGASNLAYSPGWEGSAEELFDFPESDQVTFQRMYGRDGVTAFHGTERGLEHFTRLLVVQQAAISPIRLANLADLRDLAWADLPYVCVRDDIGDRWFANVRVPGERVHQRALYMATVDITEVTQTASPTDPGA